MSDEYEYGPWVGWNGGERPVGCKALVVACVYGPGKGLHVLGPDEAHRFAWDNESPRACGMPIIAYRIATPKPKRELVVGKWYRDKSQFWRKCLYVCDGNAWLTLGDTYAAHVWDVSGEPKSLNRAYLIDWSTPPRDEAPE